MIVSGRAKAALATARGLAEAQAGVACRMVRADAFAATVAPVIAEAQAAGARSLRRIAVALNARGIATARGGK
jgi:hypothetical protein